MEAIAEEIYPELSRRIEQGFEKLKQRFIREAIEEWDNKVGILPCFEIFIKEVVQSKWDDYASRN